MLSRTRLKKLKFILIKFEICVSFNKYSENCLFLFLAGLWLKSVFEPQELVNSTRYVANYIKEINAKNETLVQISYFINTKGYFYYLLAVFDNGLRKKNMLITYLLY